jgi:hypothetical protein
LIGTHGEFIRKEVFLDEESLSGDGCDGGRMGDDCSSSKGVMRFRGSSEAYSSRELGGRW